MRCIACIYNYGRDSIDQQTHADTERAEEVSRLVALHTTSKRAAHGTEDAYCAT